MKQKLLLIIFLLSSLSIFSQQINKELVVIEIGTGTWCQYCPGAAMGADELVENFGSAVAIIKNHNGDAYTWTGSDARNSYYGITGYPTALFNGLNAVVGGSNTQSMYPSYLPKYNSAISVLTSFDATLEISPVNDYTYDVTLTVDKVDDYGGSNLVAHLVLTESDIEESWQGMSELNFVNRDMFPGATGTALDFSTADQQVINYTVTLDEEWVIEKCELVAFVQDNSNKEVLQGTKFSLNFPIGTNNVMLKEINEPTGNITICEEAISPVITVKNRGSENLTSLVVEYEVNEGGIQSFNWTGDLPFGESEEIVLDEIVFTQTETNTLEINLTLPNGEVDDDLLNNQMQVDFDKSVETTTRTYLEVDPNGSFGLPWEVIDSDGTVVYSGNASGSSVVTEVFFLDMDNCYKFNIESSLGNGIPGDGYFQLIDSEDNIIYFGAGDSFTDIAVVPFKVTMLSSINDILSDSYSIYPNPASDIIIIKSEINEIRKINITDLTGREIYSNVPKNISKEFTVNAKHFTSGIYFVNIYSDNHIFSEKIIVKH